MFKLNLMDHENNCSDIEFCDGRYAVELTNAGAGSFGSPLNRYEVQRFPKSKISYAEPLR